MRKKLVQTRAKFSRPSSMTSSREKKKNINTPVRFLQVLVTSLPRYVFLQVLVTDIVTNRKQKIPSQITGKIMFKPTGHFSSYRLFTGNL